jgi:hypothetical protein
MTDSVWRVPDHRGEWHQAVVPASSATMPPALVALIELMQAPVVDQFVRHAVHRAASEAIMRGFGLRDRPPLRAEHLRCGPAYSVRLLDHVVAHGGLLRVHESFSPGLWWVTDLAIAAVRNGSHGGPLLALPHPVSPAHGLQAQARREWVRALSNLEEADD